MRFHVQYLFMAYILEYLAEKFYTHLLKMMHINFNKARDAKWGNPLAWLLMWSYFMCVAIYFNCIVYFNFPLDMSQFGLGSANSHWGYSSANYSPYLTGSGLSTCGTTSAAQFNNPALGFSCSATDQTSTQDFTNNARECLPSKL